MGDVGTSIFGHKLDGETIRHATKIGRESLQGRTIQFDKMTESKALPPNNNSVTAAEIARFQRVGGLVFAIGGFIQGLLTILVVLAILARNYVYHAASFYGADPTWSGLWDELRFEMPLWISLGSATVLLMIPSFLMGRWGGRVIGLKKLRYGWVGLISVVILSVFASSCMCFIGILLDDELANDFRRHGTRILALFTLIYLVPGIVTGIVSGLTVRQRIRSESKQTAEA